MAMTNTVSYVHRGTKMFQGAFSDMWFVKGTIDTGGNVTVAAGLKSAITVPGVALGDIVLGFSVIATPNDSDGIGVITANVTAANEVTINFTVANADITDPWADKTYYLVIGRPSW